MDYRRVWVAGGTYFFTVNLLERKGNDLLVRHIDILRIAVARVKAKHPFIVHAWVVLLDHIHCVIELTYGDSNFALRWRLIKILFSKGCLLMSIVQQCVFIVKSAAFDKDVTGNT